MITPEAITKALSLALAQGASAEMLGALLDLEFRTHRPRGLAWARFEVARWRTMRRLRQLWRTAPIH